MGSAIALALIDHPDVTEVQVCDARSRSLQELQARVKGHPAHLKLHSFQVDAYDLVALEPTLRGSACIMGCSDPERNLALADLALNIGSHFCDIGGNEKVVRRQLALAERARANGLWIIPNCGLDPGLVNILCLRGIGQFDGVEAAQIRIGNVPLHPEPPFNFRVGWSAQKVVDDYTNPIHRIQDGVLKASAPFSDLEDIHFDAPFTAMEAFCTAGTLLSLLEALEGKVQTLDHKTIRWPGHAQQMRFLLGLGFGEPRNIDVRTHLTYRDLLVRRLKQRLGGVHADAVLLRVLVRGHQGNALRTLVYEMVDRYDEATGLMAMQRCTSIPAMVVALMVASGEVEGGGAALPEQVLPHERYCALLEEHGLTITTSWYEGHLSITRPYAPRQPQPSDHAG